jgi:glucose/arabinose dehydrogenase
MDMQTFIQNRQRFPLEELQKYAGKYIAWSPDGTQVVASGDEEALVEKAVKEAGYDPSEVVFSYVSSPDEVLLGGGGILE